MELSKKAINELRDVLIKKIGPKATSEMDDNELEEIGMFLLTALAEGLKLKVREEELNSMNPEKKKELIKVFLAR